MSRTEGDIAVKKTESWLFLTIGGAFRKSWWGKITLWLDALVCEGINISTQMTKCLQMRQFCIAKVKHHPFSVRSPLNTYDKS